MGRLFGFEAGYFLQANIFQQARARHLLKVTTGFIVALAPINGKFPAPYWLQSGVAAGIKSDVIQAQHPQPSRQREQLPPLARVRW